MCQDIPIHLLLVDDLHGVVLHVRLFIIQGVRSHITLCQANDAKASLSENPPERKVVVDASHTAKRWTTVNPLHKELAHLDALDPHVLLLVRKQIAYSFLLRASVQNVETIGLARKNGKGEGSTRNILQGDAAVCSDFGLVAHLVVVIRLHVTLREIGHLPVRQYLSR